MADISGTDFYLAHENRLLPIKPFSTSAIKYLCTFPDYYEYGLPNIGMQTIYRECYNHPNVIPDRYYFPREDWQDKHLTWEQRIPALECDVIGFSISYEGAYLNILKCLDYFGVPFNYREE